MAQHRALRIAGRPAGEHDLGEGSPVDRRGGQGLGPSGEVGQGLDPDNRQAQGASRRFGLTGGKDELRTRLLDDLAPEIDRMPDVERDGDAAGVGDCQEGQAPFRSIDGPDDRPVAGTEAGIGEDASGTRDGRGQVAVGQRPRPERRSNDQRRAFREALTTEAHEVDQGLHGSSVDLATVH